MALRLISRNAIRTVTTVAANAATPAVPAVAPRAASRAATTAAPEEGPQRNFKRGGTEIYLPNHVITFIRPKPTNPPNLATFKVPLQFNKLDLRDYLFHAYGVKVKAVRSFINQQAPARKGTFRGRWYRPRPQKMMIAELERPFVWPEAPAEGDREDFDYDLWKETQKEQEDGTQMQQARQKGEIPLRTDKSKSEETKEVEWLAKKFLSGRAKWTNNSNLDEIWDKHVAEEKKAQSKTRKLKRKTAVKSQEEKFDENIIFEEDDDVPQKKE